MALLSFQKPVIAACLKHIRTKASIEYDGINIHPPLVVNASVSSGKSMMIGHLGQAVYESGKVKGNRVKILVLQVSGILCEQNYDAAGSIGMQRSVYSASAFGGKKSTYFDVIYATIGTISRALDEPKFSAFTEDELCAHPDYRISLDKFHPDLIIPDEGHQIPWNEPGSQYMTVIRHFYSQKPHMRLVTMTGSPFRGIDSIIGPFWSAFAEIRPDDPLYPEGGVGNGQISTEFMIDQGWVVPPRFGVPHSDGYDFSSTSWESDNEFELNKLTESEQKLALILSEVVSVSNERKGTLIFCATQRHARDTVRMLENLGVPSASIGLIVDKTSQKEQARILRAARSGAIKYTVNVGVLTTGVNVPEWNTLVFLRPIGTLTLLTQAIGRVLRLLFGEGEPDMVARDLLTADERKDIIAASDKPDALIMDYAGVMDRLGSLYENPILEQAELDKARERHEVQYCPVCQAENSIHARRCIGRDRNGIRCDHFYKFKTCPDCGEKNDVVARQCRNSACARQLIDPNEVLTNKHYSDAELMRVVEQKITAGDNGLLVFEWLLADGARPKKFFYPAGGKSVQINKRLFYNEIIKEHCLTPATKKLARNLSAYQCVEMASIFAVPTHMSARLGASGKWNIGRRVFSGTADAGDANDG